MWALWLKMNKIRYLGIGFIVLASYLLISGVISLFYNETPAFSVKKSKYSFYQIGYTTSSFGGYSPYKGGITKVYVYKYKYKAEENIYSGLSIKFGYNESIKVYYNPILPFISTLNKGIPILGIIFLCILGFGFIELYKWLFRLSHNKNI